MQHHTLLWLRCDTIYVIYGFIPISWTVMVSTVTVMVMEIGTHGIPMTYPNCGMRQQEHCSTMGLECKQWLACYIINTGLVSLKERYSLPSKLTLGCTDDASATAKAYDKWVWSCVACSVFGVGRYSVGSCGIRGINTAFIAVALHSPWEPSCCLYWCYSSFDLSSIYAVKYHLITCNCLYQLLFLISTIPSPHSHIPTLLDLPTI